MGSSEALSPLKWMAARLWPLVNFPACELRKTALVSIGRSWSPPLGEATGVGRAGWVLARRYG